MQNVENKTRGALSNYWVQIQNKIDHINLLDDLVKRRKRIIKTTATLTYKVDGGKLVPHTYNKKKRFAIS